MNRLILPAVAAVSVLAGTLTSGVAQAVEIMHWDRTPLKVDLPVGQERVVMLNRNVRVGLPSSIAKPDTLRVQSAGGAIYLKADKPFDTQRVQLQDVKTSEIILVDLTAKKQGASSEDIKVVSDSSSSHDGDDKASDAEGDNDKASSEATNTPIPVTLTRYAAQSLYAPERTIENVAGIHRTAMRLPATLPSLLPSLPVAVKPIAAWQKGHYVVTAVRLVNRDPARAFKLDPRWLQGNLYSATFMHPVLGPRGTDGDTTSVFVVTRGKSLAQSVPLSQGGQP
ncbi:TIGR03749 family integrating conjugative element protein [Carnimonas bestiolae]|uniref:TIGR03749 family integrating conjugative element protein n=1 Tax=Carnimonas bestiolae TaxID=3402172 RepID=UPI003EDC3A54